MADKPELRSARNKRYYEKQKAAREAAQSAPRPAMKISDMAVERSRRDPKIKEFRPFEPYKPMKGVIGSSPMAMDEAPMQWAQSSMFGMGLDSQTFMGYPELSLLAQRPEYRVMSETFATEMTRKWIKFTTIGDDDKSDKIAKIEAELDRLSARDAFRELAEQDGFFGRAHLYLDFGTTDDAPELQKPIGDGSNRVSLAKVKQGSLERINTVEAVWCYPANYNSTDPLKPNWYRPDAWFVQGKQIHASRFLTFVGREVPDLLKPAYAFGGLSLSQMAKPYVENWLSTRQAVNDIIRAFSVFVLKTNMQDILQGGGDESFYKRLDIFNGTRDNRGVLALDKETEEFQNVSASLAGLDLLQAQAQEHMASVSQLPLVKLTGISPSGLNASSDGELRCFNDNVHAKQEAFFRPNLTRLLGFVQLSLFGEVDPAIGFEFEPLYELSEKEAAEVRKIDAEAGQIHVDTGVISPEEERRRIANSDATPYQGLDPDDAPDLSEEEDDGLEPKGGEVAKDALNLMFDASSGGA